MRIVAVDIGEKRIGVAVADDRALVAVPVGAVDAGADIAETVAKIVREQRADLLVVGLPVSLTGALGPQGQRVMALVQELSARLPVPVETWDERLSTVEAERRLGPGHPRERRDALAAAIVLQAYLDSLRGLRR
ncbi:Putative pre-16S rRNA nuclease [bacterium HR24]|jgi:putative Holliday junction resolvase|nr:Putative pre-16S rRNA nuclease [bacterium HR24]